MKTVPTPELDKMSLVKDQSRVIGKFLDWLAERKLELAYFHRHSESCDGFNEDTGEIEPEYECGDPKHDRGRVKHDFGMFGCHPTRSFGCDLPCQSLTPFRTNPEKLLAEFFEIDLKKAEEERRALLEGLRSR